MEHTYYAAHPCVQITFNYCRLQVQIHALHLGAFRYTRKQMCPQPSCIETSYSGDKWNVTAAGRTDEQGKIGLLSLWTVGRLSFAKTNVPAIYFKRGITCAMWRLTGVVSADSITATCKCTDEQLIALQCCRCKKSKTRKKHIKVHKCKTDR